MNLELAIRLTEILLALAFLLQSFEHMTGARDERVLFTPRIALSVLLLGGIWAPWACFGLLVLALAALKRFDGPYNGGSDRMGILILCCLCLVHVMPSLRWQEYVFGYLALQLVLSYFIAGCVKIANPEWRSGRALRDVFAFTAYPVAESLRVWAQRPRILFVMSWAVMLFETLFPLSLITQPALLLGLTVAAIFHFTNACLFGLNRFFWVWLAAYPSILWLQARLIPHGLGTLW